MIEKEKDLIVYLGYCETKYPTRYSYYDFPIYTYNKEHPAEGQYLSIKLQCQRDTPKKLIQTLEEGFENYPLKIGLFITNLSFYIDCPFFYVANESFLILSPLYIFSKSFKSYLKNFILFRTNKLNIELTDENSVSLFNAEINDAINYDIFLKSNYENIKYYSHKQLNESLNVNTFSRLVKTVIENLNNN